MAVEAGIPIEIPTKIPLLCFKALTKAIKLSFTRTSFFQFLQFILGLGTKFCHLLFRIAVDFRENTPIAPEHPETEASLRRLALRGSFRGLNFTQALLEPIELGGCFVFEDVSRIRDFLLEFIDSVFHPRPMPERLPIILWLVCSFFFTSLMKVFE